MKLSKPSHKIRPAGLRICSPSRSSLLVALAEDYSFKVHNNTEKTITKLLCSEDGETYGFFDIGDGIKPGETETIVWDKSTNSQACKQWFKAVWEDGDEGKPVKFDFCEKDLELEFE